MGNAGGAEGRGCREGIPLPLGNPPGCDGGLNGILMPDGGGRSADELGGGGSGLRYPGGVIRGPPNILAKELANEEGGGSGGSRGLGEEVFGTDGLDRDAAVEDDDDVGTTDD